VQWQGRGAESLLLLIQCHVFGFDRAKKFIYTLFLITEKSTRKERSVLVLYTRVSFRFTSHVAPASAKH